MRRQNVVSQASVGGRKNKHTWRPVHRPGVLSIKALSVDANAAAVAADYVLTNFRIVKALVPPPFSDHVPTTLEGVALKLTAVTAFWYYLTAPPNVVGGLFDYFGGFSNKGSTAWTTSDIGSKGRDLGKGTKP